MVRSLYWTFDEQRTSMRHLNPTLPLILSPFSITTYVLGHTRTSSSYKVNPTLATTVADHPNLFDNPSDHQSPSKAFDFDAYFYTIAYYTLSNIFIHPHTH